MRKKEKSRIEIAIDHALDAMKRVEPDTKEYAQIVDQVAKLHKMKEDEKSSGISNETLVLAGTNLLGILMILRYEHAHVITSKALGFVSRAR